MYPPPRREICARTRTGTERAVAAAAAVAGEGRHAGRPPRRKRKRSGHAQDGEFESKEKGEHKQGRTSTLAQENFTSGRAARLTGVGCHAPLGPTASGSKKARTEARIHAHAEKRRERKQNCTMINEPIPKEVDCYIMVDLVRRVGLFRVPVESRGSLLRGPHKEP